MVYFILGALVTSIIFSIVLALKRRGNDGFIYIDIGVSPPQAYMQLAIDMDKVVQKKSLTLYVDKINSRT